MAQSAIRDYLRSKGLSDGDITYNNGTVMAKGQRFMDATPQADGRTYADTGALESAYNNYDMRGQLAQMRSQATQVNPEIAAMRQALKDRISKPAQQFSYNQSADPAYKAALQSAQQNTQTAAGNIAADMNKRGLLNSTITQDRGNQAAAQEYNRVSNEIAPRLEQSAYQRYLGQQQQENQQTNNMMSLADYLDRSGQQQFRNQADLLGQQNTLNQQDVVNQRTAAIDAYNQQRNRIQDAQWGVNTYGYGEAKNDPSVFFDQYKDATPLAVQQIAQQRAVQEAGLTGQYNGQETMDSRKMAADMADRQAQLGISRMNAGTSAASASNSAGNAAFGRLMDIWQATGQAPDGIPGVAKGTPLAGKQAAPKTTDYKTNPGFATDVSFMKKNPAEAKKLDTNPEAFINEYGYDGYVALRKEAGLDK